MEDSFAAVATSYAGSSFSFADRTRLFPTVEPNLSDRLYWRESIHVHKIGLWNPNCAKNMGPVVSCGLLQSLRSVFICFGTKDTIIRL